MLGRVKWMNDKYGFLTLDNGEKDVFIHRSQLEKSRITMLAPGDKVEFDTEPGKQGLQAVNIKLIS